MFDNDVSDRQLFTAAVEAVEKSFPVVGILEDMEISLKVRTYVYLVHHLQN